MASINCEKRDGTGKGVARKLRRDGRIPAVLYGAGQENVNLSLNLREWRKVLETESQHIRTAPQDLNVEGQTSKVLVRGMQIHPVSSLPLHVDFLRFDPARRLQIMIPIIIVGEEDCPGVKRGGMVQSVRRELEVHCRADHIPEQIEISVAGMGIGDSIHIEDIQLPEGVEIHTDVNFTVAAVVGVQAEEVEGEEGAAGDEEDGAATE